jgi:hypothetical protein
MVDEGGNESDSNLEDMHYVLVNIEKIKKRMLGKIEG